MSVTAIEQSARAGWRAPVIWDWSSESRRRPTPLALWWLVAATVYALGFGMIASIYIGFTQGLAYRTPAEVARTWKDLED